MKEIWINENDAGQRLDSFLKKTFPNLSRSLMYKGIRNKKIKINRKRCAYDQRLNQGDQILLFLPEEFLLTKKINIPKNNGPIDIIYEDQNLLIVNKPAGLLSQNEKPGDDCLIDRIQYYLYQKHEFQPEKENSFAPALCHRLDRNTSGLVMASKNAKTLRIINAAIRDRKIKKYYLALVQGNMTALDLCLYLKKEGTRCLVSKIPKPGYAQAVTLIRPLRVESGNTWCEIELLTGRFHQIRASLSFVGHPLVNDVKYRGSKQGTRYYLQAYRLDLSQVDLPLKQTCFEI